MDDTTDINAGTTATGNANPKSHSLRERIDFLRPFWVSDQKTRARWMLAGILALTVAEVALSAGIGLGFQAALNAMVAREGFTFAATGLATVAGLLVNNVAGNQRQYITDNLTQDWRGWLTKQFNAAWLKDKAHFKIAQAKAPNVNPDQRIAENVPAVADQTLGLCLGFFRSVLSLATFSLMLLHLSPLMLGVAGACAVGMSLGAHKVGKPLQKIINAVQACEAKLRHSLVRVRDNSKPIALSGMEKVEEKSLTDDFNKLDAEKREAFRRQRKIGVFSTLNLQSAQIVPIAVAAPQFFLGAGSLGSLELMRQSYGQVYTAASWFTQGYPLFASWGANTDQLINFDAAIRETKTDITRRAAKPANAAPVVAFPPKSAFSGGPP